MAVSAFHAPLLTVARRDGKGWASPLPKNHRADESHKTADDDEDESVGWGRGGGGGGCSRATGSHYLFPDAARYVCMTDYRAQRGHSMVANPCSVRLTAPPSPRHATPHRATPRHALQQQQFQSIRTQEAMPRCASRAHCSTPRPRSHDKNGPLGNTSSSALRLRN